MGQIFKIHEIHLVVRQAASRQERTTDRTDGLRTRTQGRRGDIERQSFMTGQFDSNYLSHEAPLFVTHFIGF